jgi:hypothetical protein
MTRLLSPRMIWIILIALVLLLVACGGAAAPQNQAQEVVMPVSADSNTVEFYHTEFCGCCDYHADAFVAFADTQKEITINLIDADSAEIADLKRAAGIPLELWSCHTAFVDGYFLEGHVPLSAVEWLLTERPDYVRGIATRHAEGEMDTTTWLGQAYYVVYTDGNVIGPLPAP